MDNYGNYPIFIDKRWSLEDLYRFPRAYEQVYFAYEAVLPAPDEQTNERIERAFQAFPWRGGYSAVNFYNQLKYATPPKKRPMIQQMRYASPGYIELFLNLPLALQVAIQVGAIAGSIGTCNKVYNAIYSDIQRRKLLKLDVERKKIELTREQISLLTSSSEEMAKLLGLPSADPILRRTKNPLVALKILLSIYRRVRTLAEYQYEGKANLAQRTGPDEDGKFF